MKAILAPSLLSADFANLGAECRSLENAGIPWLHLDVMDGAFAPNITFGAPLIRSLRPLSGLFFDVHLMVENPERYFEAFAAAGADILVPHLEGMRHPHRSLAQARECGARVGVALNPSTNISSLRWLLPLLDMVLIMGVNPGFSGQAFIDSTLAKVEECREYLERHGHGHIAIQVDGGVCIENAAALASAGANILVSGSAFFKLGDASRAMREFGVALDQAALSPETARALALAKRWRHN